MESQEELNTEVEDKASATVEETSESIEDTPNVECTDASDAEKDFNELQKSLQEMENKYLRSLADYENYKRRAAIDYANAEQNVATKILKPLLDIFEAVYALDIEQLASEAPKQAEALQMIQKMLNKQEETLDLERFAKVGDAFDPNAHQAVMMENNPDVADDTITEVLKKGYRYNGKVLQFALVKVNQHM